MHARNRRGYQGIYYAAIHIPPCLEVLSTVKYMQRVGCVNLYIHFQKFMLKSITHPNRINDIVVLTCAILVYVCE